jgi:hypothetical protein
VHTDGQMLILLDEATGAKLRQKQRSLHQCKHRPSIDCEHDGGPLSLLTLKLISTEKLRMRPCQCRICVCLRVSISVSLKVKLFM